ncbi:MAG: tRNA threonylcarbamoyl adenosine modification protein (Sua5/YciO/YrdC/YwlC family) [Bacteroidia bacterium]|jgi:tRNA threonylcarbamoyl adenosine modification protein (Sua5/YciO/YrdC/YwlC family)
MPAEYLELHEHTPDKRRIRELAEAYKQGKIIVIPTDTIYALSCDLKNKKAIDALCRLLGKKPNKANLSLLCRDLTDLATYCKPLSNPIFKLMKRVLPGPFTFILKATNDVSKIFKTNKRTVGIRVPNNAVVNALVLELGNPIVSSSIHSEDEILDYITDPTEIYEIWKHKVDFVIDGGVGQNQGSTVIDCTERDPFIVREGLGMEALA